MVTIGFPIQHSVVLLIGGMAVFMFLMPYVEAAEQTVLQKVVPLERQGRVFGFAQSVEQSASPLTAFLISPLAQFVFMPFMAEGGAGARLIGSWFGVGSAAQVARGDGAHGLDVVLCGGVQHRAAAEDGRVVPLLERVEHRAELVGGVFSGRLDGLGQPAHHPIASCLQHGLRERVLGAEVPVERLLGHPDPRS